jgi:ATP-binding cassette subfamily B protein RaxB
MNRISDIILESPEDNKNRSVEVSSLQGNIKIENLSFSYPNEKKMLINNLCFSIQQGEFVVLTGASGCGKTTLLKLMLGLYNSDNGKICYDEHDISQCDLRSLRKQFGTVMQNDVIFSGTVASNIALFDPCPDPEQLRRVSRMAMIDDVIENFPLKYETIIGQNGGPLSGGQKQRLILARALYKNPKILFIDEGMAFLDVKTEIQVNKNLRSMNITRVTVAHRPESIRLADKIFNLDKQIFEDKDTYMVDLDMLKQ